jgi:hypothetical protein
MSHKENFLFILTDFLFFYSFDNFDLFRSHFALMNSRSRAVVRYVGSEQRNKERMLTKLAIVVNCFCIYMLRERGRDITAIHH